MSAKHTSGPWSVIRKDTRTIYIALTPNAAESARRSYGWLHHHLFCLAGTGLGDPQFTDRHMPEVAANAHLISAAPDLLEALEEITADYSDRFDLDSPSTNPGIKTSIARARAALAKAKGQP